MLSTPFAHIDTSFQSSPPLARGRYFAAVKAAPDEEWFQSSPPLARGRYFDGCGRVSNKQAVSILAPSRERALLRD